MGSQGGRGELQCSFDWGELSPAQGVLEALVSFEDGDACASELLGGPLNDYVDTDALNTLVASDQDIRISFVARAYNVAIEGDEVRVSSSE